MLHGRLSSLISVTKIERLAAFIAVMDDPWSGPLFLPNTHNPSHKSLLTGGFYVQEG